MVWVPPVPVTASKSLSLRTFAWSWPSLSRTSLPFLPARSAGPLLFNHHPPFLGFCRRCLRVHQTSGPRSSKPASPQPFCALARIDHGELWEPVLLKGIPYTSPGSFPLAASPCYLLSYLWPIGA